MSLKKLIKKSSIYKQYKKRRHIAKHELLEREGSSLLKEFIQCCTSCNITYWLEFGTLLGAYRDKKFIQNDIDIDVAVYLKDARTLYGVLTNSGFKLVREFHVVGENGLEQTYEFNGLTIDVMYFYEHENTLWCNGVGESLHKTKFAKYRVSAHYFQPFGISEIDFLGMKVCIPDNVEDHLKEIFGDGFRVYDPDFSGDLNKILYPINEKYAIGFVLY